MGQLLKIEDFVPAPSVREKRLEKRVEALKATVAKLKRDNKALAKIVLDPHYEHIRLLNEQMRLARARRMEEECRCTPYRHELIRGR